MAGKHVHSDGLAAAYIIVVALVGFNLIRLGSAYLVTKGGLPAKIGATTGALVHFSA